MNWLYIGIAFIVLSPVLIGIGAKQERKNGEAPQAVQYGYMGVIIGAFIVLVQQLSISWALLLFVLVTGVIWLLDKFMLAKKRGDAPPADWVEFGRGFFPVIFVVFLLRSFVVEPYQIPSSSMRPGLVVGDFILVNKFVYGLRLPILNDVVIPVSTPQHGDVMVFNYPEDPKLNYIKRVIGVPGDVVDYHNKRLTINGKPVPTMPAGPHTYQEGPEQVANEQYLEHYGEHQYHTLAVPNQPAVAVDHVGYFQYRENCRYDEGGFTCTVPDKHYFMMGDNRDHSGDSRYWGFVPDSYIVGKAFFVWFNLKELGRIGTRIQ
ncbi:signal peptidase I [Andreprevotia lacus DSM 23236]|jgi:signal peptidase I|uniref:Signal peptidase I n=1 Tax=Andreprevotia lacus DSM 23236 TaxID=1121001 RepID=A0A1W1XMW4_9NEIS|nr:signal peptidase I [Andreprevotia lacus]SMC25293.1 signal peptidase I [Andreprevotia lacus DSM 23236]